MSRRMSISELIRIFKGRRSTHDLPIAILATSQNLDRKLYVWRPLVNICIKATRTPNSHLLHSTTYIVQTYYAGTPRNPVLRCASYPNYKNIAKALCNWSINVYVPNWSFGSIWHPFWSNIDQFQTSLGFYLANPTPTLTHTNTNTHTNSHSHQHTTPAQQLKHIVIQTLN